MAAVGFRFHPTEEEIIGHYLTLKLNGCDSDVDEYIGEIDHLYRRDPWDLPAFAKIQSDDRVWYFFCRLDYKYLNSKRANRTTENGNWKLTGKVRDIKLRGRDVIGTKKNLVFQYKCPATKKVVGTCWVIHEFQAKNSPPDERALVLCKLKFKGDDSAATSPNDEGEPSWVTRFDFGNNAVQTNIREVQIEKRLGPLIENHEEDFNPTLPLQSQNHVPNWLSDEEDPIEFADSIIIFPDENDHSPPRSSSKAYVGSSTGYGVVESSNFYGGHGGSTEYRQMQMANSDDILLMGAPSMGSTTATRHEQINLMQSVEEFPRIEKPLPPQKLPSFEGREQVSHKKRYQLQSANIDLPRKESFGIESDRERKMVPVINPKPDANSRSNESAGNDRKGRFIHLETTISSRRSSSQSVNFFNAVLGVVMFLIILGEMLIVH